MGRRKFRREFVVFAECSFFSLSETVRLQLREHDNCEELIRHFRDVRSHRSPASLCSLDRGHPAKSPKCIPPPRRTARSQSRLDYSSLTHNKLIVRRLLYSVSLKPKIHVTRRVCSSQQNTKNRPKTKKDNKNITEANWVLTQLFQQFT